MNWEYRIVQFDPPTASKKSDTAVQKLEAALNRAGQDGWELVGTPIFQAFGSNTVFLAIFKRAKTQ